MKKYKPFMICDGEDAAMLGALVLLQRRIEKLCDHTDEEAINQLKKIKMLQFRLARFIADNGWWPDDADKT